MKKLIPVFVLVILASLAGYQTLAYYTTQTTTQNVITTGSLEMELYSMTFNQKEELVALETEIQNILPGDTYIQMPFVENTGEEDFYARVYLESTITKGKDNPLPNPLEFNINDEYWVLDSDGWYRYKYVIKAGETVLEPLFTEVHFPGKEMGNEYVGSTTTITLQGQSVQAANNEYDDAAGETILDVQGWPAKTETTTETTTEIGGNG